MTDEVSFDGGGEIQIARLNRPDIGNRMSASMVEDFHAGLDDFECAGGRVLIIQGEGRNFCTGFDLTGLEGLSDGDLLLRFVRIEELLARLWSASYSTIAVGQGHVVGAGADLFTVCQRRAAVVGASISFPGSRFGIALGTRRLSVRIGEVAAMEVVAGGRTLSALEAAQLGLATTCLSQGDISSWLESEIASAQRIDRATSGHLRRALREDIDHLDADLANLVRSAARAGLRERILRFRAARNGESISQSPPVAWETPSPTTALP